MEKLHGLFEASNSVDVGDIVALDGVCRDGAGLRPGLGVRLGAGLGLG